MNNYEDKLEEYDDEVRERIRSIKEGNGLSVDDWETLIQRKHDYEELIDEVGDESDEKLKVYRGLDSFLKNNRKEMVKAGWKAYEDSEDLIEMNEDYKELSVGSLMAMLSDDEKYDFSKFDDIERLWNEYENQRKDKKLPEINPAFLAGNTDPETAKRDLINFRCIDAEVNGPGELSQLYDTIEALKTENGDTENTGGPGLGQQLGATAIGALLLGAAGAADAEADPDTDFELVDGYHPSIVTERNETREIIGNATDEINIRGTINTTQKMDLNLDAENLSGGVEIPTQEGNITITEQDGHLELATGNATIKLNETDANITLDETTGDIFFEGQLDGTSLQDFESEFESSGQMDAEIYAEFVEDTREVKSLVPYLAAGAAAGFIYGGFMKIKNRELWENVLKGKEIKGKGDIGNIATSVYDKAKEYDDDYKQGVKNMAKVLRDAHDEIEE